VEARAAVVAHTRDVIGRSGFRFSLPGGAAAVGTGGTVTTVRTVLGAPEGKPFEATSPVVTRPQIVTLLDSLGRLTLTERQKIPGLPPARADVFPVALATLLAVAELGGFDRYENSLFNLRYGLAAELLSNI
jgi:exopolyphosphatase / guanosine-5'-triphosphate,3'-diphosphate pyrophosphatase